MEAKDITRAGIIPYARVDSRVKLLLGQGHSGKWSEFGGRVDHDESLLDTAVREFMEEISGFYREDDVRRGIANQEPFLIRSIKPFKTYIYLLEVEYDPELPSYFKNVYSFFLECADGKTVYGAPIISSCPSGYLEKTDLWWYNLADVPQKNLVSQTMYKIISYLKSTFNSPT